MPHFVNFVRILPLFLLNVNDFYIYVVLVAHYIYIGFMHQQKKLDIMTEHSEIIDEFIKKKVFFIDKFNNSASIY